jgi:hypothetical protein
LCQSLHITEQTAEGNDNNSKNFLRHSIDLG